MKLSREQRQQICNEYSQGSLQKQLATKYGVSQAIISVTLSLYEVARRPSKKTRILSCYANNPNMSDSDIANALGICHATVRCTLNNHRMRGDNIMALGRAARAAGLTVEAIRALSRNQTRAA